MKNLSITGNTMPQRVLLEEISSIVRLADNITEIETDEGQIMYSYDEVCFKLPDDRNETEESIENNFDSWWLYGSQPDEPEPTLEDRVKILEDLVLSM